MEQHAVQESLLHFELPITDPANATARGWLGRYLERADWGMRVIRAVPRITAFSGANAPPERPVPAPRGVQGIPASKRSLTA